MPRYIDAYKLITAVRTFFFTVINEAEPLMADDEEAFDLKIVNPLLEANKVIRRIIREQPTVDVVKVVHGEWIEDIAYYDENGCPCIVARCSNCGEAYPTYNYCPNCGAKMDLKGEDDEQIH